MSNDGMSQVDSPKDLPGEAGKVFQTLLITVIGLLVMSRPLTKK